MDLTTLATSDLDGAVRLGVAVAVGMAIGLNRDLRGKPTGVRTLGLVSLGSCLVAVAALRVDGMMGHADATSRVLQGVIQGVLSGIGFVGAGVVLRNPVAERVQGLTTAASVWMTASLGIACAIASWPVILSAVGLSLVLLVAVHPLERWLEARAGKSHDGSLAPGSRRAARLSAGPRR